MKKTLAVAAIFFAMMPNLSFAKELQPTEKSIVDQVVKTLSEELNEQEQISQQGFNAMQDIQYARLFLFKGYPDTANNLIKKAKSILSSDSSDWKKFLKKDKQAPLAGDNYIVIDASISISDDHRITNEKLKAIGKANEKIKEKNHKEAIETLQNAGISITETQILMPLKLTLQSVEKALQQMKDGKYYEANLTLKGAEEGVISESITLSE